MKRVIAFLLGFLLFPLLVLAIPFSSSQAGDFTVTNTPIEPGVISTAIIEQPKSTQPPGLPSNRGGEVSSTNWQFRIYLKQGKFELWGLVNGYPKLETDSEAYTKYYTVTQPTQVVTENKTLKDWKNGIKISQLAGTKDGLTITCQANIMKIDGTEETQEFICGTITK